MAPWPVVHWQVTSVTPQPEPGMAATRQATFLLDQYEETLQWELGRHTAQSGTAERSGVWAETTASEVANAAMVEKRMVSLFDYKRFVIVIKRECALCENEDSTDARYRWIQHNLYSGPWAQHTFCTCLSGA